MTGAAGFAHIGFRVGKALKQNRKEPQKNDWTWTGIPRLN